MTVDLSKKKEELHREISHLSLPQCLVMMGVLLERSMILSNMQKKPTMTAIHLPDATS